MYILTNNNIVDCKVDQVSVHIEQKDLDDQLLNSL